MTNPYESWIDRQIGAAGQRGSAAIELFDVAEVVAPWRRRRR